MLVGTGKSTRKILNQQKPEHGDYMCNRQCYKSIITKIRNTLTHTRLGIDTHLHCTLQFEPCVYLNITTMGNIFLLTTKEWNAMILISDQISFRNLLSSQNTNLLLYRDSERENFELASNLSQQIHNYYFLLRLIGIWFRFNYVIKISKKAQNAPFLCCTYVHDNEITEIFCNVD